MLWRKQGKGTFVSQLRIREDLRTPPVFAEEAIALGKTPELRILSKKTVKPTKEIARMLEIDSSDDLLELTGLRLADHEPMILRTSYYPIKVVPQLVAHEFDSTPLVEVLRRFGIRALRSSQTFQVVPCRSREARYLKIETGSPVLLWEGTFYTENDKPFSFARSYYRSDKFEFQIEQYGESLTDIRMRPRSTSATKGGT